MSMTLTLFNETVMPYFIIVITTTTGMFIYDHSFWNLDVGFQILDNIGATIAHFLECFSALNFF